MNRDEREAERLRRNRVVTARALARWIEEGGTPLEWSESRTGSPPYNPPDTVLHVVIPGGMHQEHDIESVLWRLAHEDEETDRLSQ